MHSPLYPSLRYGLPPRCTRLVLSLTELPSDDHEEEGDKLPDMIFKACVRDETIGDDLL
jgi:hypothetical protein